MSIIDSIRDRRIALHHPARHAFEETFGPVKQFMMDPEPLGFDVLAFDDYLKDHLGFDPYGTVSTRDFVAAKTSTWVADWVLHLAAPDSLPLPPTHPSA